MKPDVTRISVAEGTLIRSVCFLDPQLGFVSGGRYGSEGYIFRTGNGGESWEPVFESAWSVNDVRFLNDTTGLACGDSLRILKSTDRGLTWNPVELSWYPNPEYHVPLKHIAFADDTTWFFTGGRNYQYGINIRTQNGGYWWDNEVFQVELNASFFRDDKYGLLAGYGIIYITPDANVSFIPTAFKGDNITSMSFNGPENGLACGYDGGIYTSTDGGATWETSMKPNGYLGRRLHFNKILNHSGGCMAAGNAGTVFYSGNGGGSWSEIDLDADCDFYDVIYMDGQFVLAGDGGDIFKLKI